MPDSDKQDIYRNFQQAVNMTASQLTKWLATDQSQSVGIKKSTSTDKKTSAGGEESAGHESGRKIIEILDKKKADLHEADYAHMKKVVGYVNRHLAQKPSHEAIEDSRWRYSLMNWGHDPLNK